MRKTKSSRVSYSKPKARLVFRILGKFDPEYAKRVLGLRGAKIGYKGELVSPSPCIIRHKQNTLKFEQSLKHGFDLDTEIGRLLKKIPNSRMKKVNQISHAKIYLEMFVRKGMDIRECSIYITPRTVRKMAALRIGFDMDIYCP